jgi:hypothetical protein
MRVIELEAARYRLGKASPESLRSLAEALLAEGHDEAVKLAIVEEPTMADVGPLFEEMCAELGQPIPSVPEAVDIVIRATLQAIADGSVDPEPGVKELVDVYAFLREQASPGGYVGESHGIEGLVAARWGYDDLRERPTELSIDGKYGEAAIPLLDADVRRLANEWLTAR